MKFEKYIAVRYIRKVYLHLHVIGNFCAWLRSKFWNFVGESSDQLINQLIDSDSVKVTTGCLRGNSHSKHMREHILMKIRCVSVI